MGGPARGATSPGSAPVRRAFNCLVAFHHFFHQSSNFVATARPVSTRRRRRRRRRSFVGKLERRRGLGQTGGHVRRHSRPALRYDPLPNGGGHRKHRITTRRRRCRGAWRATTRWWRFVWCTSTITRGIVELPGVRRELPGDEPSDDGTARERPPGARDAAGERDRPVCG